MTQYLKCIKAARGQNSEECRLHAKGYLQCRMDRNLMAPDEFKNLGCAEKDVAAGKDKKSVNKR